jgi:hypothetical protein
MTLYLTRAAQAMNSSTMGSAPSRELELAVARVEEKHSEQDVVTVEEFLSTLSPSQLLDLVAGDEEEMAKILVLAPSPCQPLINTMLDDLFEEMSL